MTIEAVYGSLIKNAHQPDHDLYDKYYSLVTDHIQKHLSELEADDHPEVLPLNYCDRISYIKANPYKYHSIVQLNLIYTEFVKKHASYCVRRNKK
ncbi:hypothetical protein GCM10022378_14720 [Salinicoccus jeotgali]|uniref:YpoC-like domain-containing protein n=1 Tax=Salinicoccus jeotgali TaxID=381634 RepID=A0ABP7EVS8_9STAP